MKAASIRDLKKELQHQDEKELLELCLRLVRFKKDNKELLTYLLFESQDEEAFIEGIKEEMDEQLQNLNMRSFYQLKKSIRKTLRSVKKNIRYSKQKETEIQLLMHFCLRLKEMDSYLRRSQTLRNLYARQIQIIEKAMTYLHEDLQFDYRSELDELRLL